MLLYCVCYILYIQWPQWWIEYTNRGMEIQMVFITDISLTSYCSYSYYVLHNSYVYIVNLFSLSLKPELKPPHSQTSAFFICRTIKIRGRRREGLIRISLVVRRRLGDGRLLQIISLLVRRLPSSNIKASPDCPACDKNCRRGVFC